MIARTRSLLLPLLFAAAVSAAAVSPAQRRPHRKPKLAVSRASATPAMPFRVGEDLRYQIAWTRFTDAASIELSIPERRNLFGWQTWHFRAAAHTVSPVRTLFTIDDQFDSYTDAATLESRQYEMYLDELGRKETSILRFVAEGQSSRAPGPFFFVPPGTRDPLGELYLLRAVDWQREPDVKAIVSDGRDVYHMDARLAAPATRVSVPAGNFSATRIAVSAQQSGGRNAFAFTLWLAHDGPRTPVLIQADMPFGTLRVRMVSGPAASPAPN